MYVRFNNVQFYQKKKSHAIDAVHPNWFMFGFCSLSDFQKQQLVLEQDQQLILEQAICPSQAGAVQLHFDGMTEVVSHSPALPNIEM